jgi:hypothetical protein
MLFNLSESKRLHNYYGDTCVPKTRCGTVCYRARRSPISPTACGSCRSPPFVSLARPCDRPRSPCASVYRSPCSYRRRLSPCAPVRRCDPWLGKGNASVQWFEYASDADRFGWPAP